MAMIEAQIILIYFVKNFKMKLKENFEMRKKFGLVIMAEDDKFL